MASSREHRGTAREKNLSYHQSVEYDEYEDEYPNENSDRTYNRNALYHSEYTEDEDDGYDDDDNNNAASISTSNIPPPPPSRSKKLPSIPQYVPDKSQTAFRPSAPTPTHQKRKINNYFTIGSLTSRLKFKKSHAKEEETRNNDSPLPEPPQHLQITLPSLAPSSPISHQLPAEYLDFEEETDNHSEVHTTPELTMDDLYHLVLNMQKGFQLQVDEMNTQIKELKREIKKLKGEESEEEQEEDNDLEDFMIRSPSRTATSVRSVAREMERYGGEGRWFHNEYS